MSSPTETPLSTELPDYLKIPAVNGSPSTTVILLHGLGGSGHDLSSLARHFQADPALAHVQFFFSNAPTRAITATAGRRMPAWSDIPNLDFTGPEDEAGMRASIASIHALIAHEVGAGPDARVVLGGFSQGAGLSLLMGLTAEKRFAGLAVLSGRLPIRDVVKATAAPHATSLPIFYGLGTADARYEIIRASAEFLRTDMGIQDARPGSEGCEGLELHVYGGMGHSVSEEERRDLGVWLKRVLPA